MHLLLIDFFLTYEGGILISICDLIKIGAQSQSSYKETKMTDNTNTFVTCCSQIFFK